MVKESLKDRYEWVAIFHYKGESWKRMKLRGGSTRKLIFGAPRREKRSPSLRGAKKGAFHLREVSNVSRARSSEKMGCEREEGSGIGFKDWRASGRTREDLIYLWKRVSFSLRGHIISLSLPRIRHCHASYFISNNLDAVRRKHTYLSFQYLIPSVKKVFLIDRIWVSVNATVVEITIFCVSLVHFVTTIFSDVTSRDVLKKIKIDILSIQIITYSFHVASKRKRARLRPKEK